jgi:bacterial leucyl aminopeptidase
MVTVFFSESALDSSIDETRQLLNSLRQGGVQIGLIDYSRRFNDASDLRLTTFSSFSEARNLRGDHSFFVSKDSLERAEALKAGFAAAIPHPRLVSEVLEGGTLVYARVSGLNNSYTDQRLDRFLNMPMVPVYFTQAQGYVYVITSARAANLMASMGFDVTVFGEEHDPQITDLYLVGFDLNGLDEASGKQIAGEFLAQQNKARFIAGSEEGGFLFALPSYIEVQSLYIPGMRERQSRRLMADATLLKSLHDDTWLNQPSLKLNLSATLSQKELEILAEVITPQTIERFHAPYVGHAPLVIAGKEYTIHSRHKAHPENKIATDGLLEQLKTIGSGLLKVQPCDFWLGDKLLSNVEAELPGTEAGGIVIISAHFDSTAIDVLKFYPAPGADDDASGIAAVLAAAEAALKIRREVGPFKKSLRFVLFNAEEDGVLGSAEYAAKQAADNVKIEAVFQMDMIGYRKYQNYVFEIHAGYSGSQAIQTASLALAQRVSDMISNQWSPQIYPRNNGYDPAQGNSDHTRFHEHNYAACMVSEDYNTDHGDPDPDPEVNPNRHKSGDETIDYAYAAEIARAVIAAAFLTAKG